jgi:hypothetical protein
MDYLQDQLHHLLTNTSLSPSTIRTIYTYTSTFYTHAHTITTYLRTYLRTYLSALLPSTGLTTLPTTPADLLSLTLLLLILFTTYKVVDYIRRMVMFWVFLVFKLIALLLCVQLALYLYTYGVEKTLRDLGWVVGWVEGLVENMMRQGQGQGQGQQGYRYGQQQAGYGWDERIRNAAGRGRQRTTHTYYNRPVREGWI